MDFNNPEYLTQILCMDKHARIEGLCSELAFLKDVAEGQLQPITSDFWFSMNSNNRVVWKVITDPDAGLIELDYRILDGLTWKHAKANVNIAYFDETRQNFYCFTHTAGQRYQHIIGKGNPMSKSPFPEVDDNLRDPHRLKLACNFLAERGALKQAAIKRLWANCYMHGPFLDIDAFTITDLNKVVAIETKHKYPYGNTQKLYGINESQAKLLNYLLGLGMCAIYLILRKPDEGKDIPAVELLTLPKYTKDAVWLYKQFCQQLCYSVGNAPAKTSLYGEHEMSCFEIPETEYSFLKQYGVAAPNIKEILFLGLPAKSVGYVTA